MMDWRKSHCDVCGKQTNKHTSIRISGVTRHDDCHRKVVKRRLSDGSEMKPLSQEAQAVYDGIARLGSTALSAVRPFIWLGICLYLAAMLFAHPGNFLMVGLITLALLALVLVPIFLLGGLMFAINALAVPVNALGRKTDMTLRFMAKKIGRLIGRLLVRR